MIYPYQCPNCNHRIEIEKPITVGDREETCVCGSKLQRIFTTFGISGAKVEASYFSHALGKVVPSAQYERQEAKARDMIEVGNEDVRKHTKIPETKYPTLDELHKLGAFN